MPQKYPTVLKTYRRRNYHATFSSLMDTRPSISLCDSACRNSVITTRPKTNLSFNCGDNFGYTRFLSSFNDMCVCVYALHVYPIHTVSLSFVQQLVFLDMSVVHVRGHAFVQEVLQYAAIHEPWVPMPGRVVHDQHSHPFNWYSASYFELVVLIFFFRLGKRDRSGHSRSVVANREPLLPKNPQSNVPRTYISAPEAQRQRDGYRPARSQGAQIATWPPSPSMGRLHPPFHARLLFR